LGRFRGALKALLGALGQFFNDCVLCFVLSILCFTPRCSDFLRIFCLCILMASPLFVHSWVRWPRHGPTCFTILQWYRHSCTCFEALFTSWLDTPAHAAGILNCNENLHQVFRILGWIVLASMCKSLSYIPRASRSLAKISLMLSPRR